MRFLLVRFFAARFVSLLPAIGIALFGMHAFAADSYPDRPITFVVASGTGGDLDRLARALANYMTHEVGQPILVEDHPGAGNMIGHKYFLQRPADGYTFLITAAHPYIATNILVEHANFTLDDFDFIDTLWSDEVGIYANKNRPYKTLGQTIEAIKANPGKISLSAIYGSSGQIGALALEEALGLPSNAIRIIRYDSGADTKTAVAGGTVDLTGNQVNGMEAISSFVVPLGVFEPHRVPDFDGPTINEGLAPYHVSVPSIRGSMRTFVAHPAFEKNFPDRYKFIVAALKRTLARPDFQTFIKSQKMAADWIGPEASKAAIYQNFDIWKKYVYLFKR